jgi:prolyl 4-hydroxylase
MTVIDHRTSIPVKFPMGDNAVQNIQTLSDDPKIYLIHDFITEEYCKHLIKLAEPRMGRSTVQASHSNTKHRDRTSFTTNLEKSEDKTVKDIELMASIYGGVPIKNLEPLQVVRYHPNQFYKPHYDYFVPGAEGTEEALKKGGQRTITFFVYLNNLEKDEKGGSTDFPKIGIKVRPKMGTALVFWNLKPDGTVDDRLLHAGEPPQMSVKYGLNIWARQKPYI